MQNQSTPAARGHARALRKDMTESERRLWSCLRMEQLGVKFRRQHPVGPYIADFACLEPKLIIELDGAQHAEQAGYDAKRDAFLHAQGFDVLRFAANEPFLNPEGVLQVIIDRLPAARQLAVDHTPRPPSQPSPRGGRSKTNLEH